MHFVKAFGILSKAFFRLKYQEHSGKRLKFQSTRPCGARHHKPILFRLELVISIHTPTWGATYLSVATAMYLYNFNPRAHVGRDVMLPYGRQKEVNFNPRAHVGRDYRQLEVLALLLAFQSTRPRGARQQK